MDANQKPSEGLKFKLSQDGTSYILASIGKCRDTNIIIPSTYNGKPVTDIGNYAFHGCTSLKNIILPDSITSICYSAFSDCDSLTSITIPNSVTSIDDYTFFYCTSLASITIPSSVMSIGNSAFYGCTSLTDIHYNGSASDLYNLIKDLRLPDDVELHFEDGACTVGELEEHFDRGDDPLE